MSKYKSKYERNLEKFHLKHQHKPLRRIRLRPEKRIPEMQQYIQRNFREYLTVEDIAAAAGISVTECERCFRRETGMPPYQWLREYRLQKGREFLLLEQSSVQEIAKMVGFQSSSAFVHAFSRRYGCSPGRYRAEARRKQAKENETTLHKRPSDRI